MNNFIQKLKDIWSIDELRRKIIYTFILILVYRIGTFIVLPGIDPLRLNELSDSGSKGLFGIFNMFAGGAFSRASVFALGVMPYISASIVIQLLTIAVPYFSRLQKDGESGRKKINQLTRYVTVLVTVLQASAYVKYLTATLGDSILIQPALFWASTTIVLTAGTIFVMWLGEKITDRGLGNGTSLLIMSGIISTLPGSFYAEFVARLGGQNGGLLVFLIEILLLVAVVFVTIALIQAVRRIPVNYAKRLVTSKELGGERQYIPLKVNIAGVMPIIFAQAILFIPSTIAQVAGGSSASNFINKFLDYNTLPYNIFMFLMVVVFTFFYTALIINPTQMSDDLKRNNGYIPGVKPGPDTAEFIDAVLSKITFPGAIILGLIAIMPSLARILGVNSQFAVFFGGTSLLITISVILDTLQQVESHLLMRHYDGLTQSGTRIRGRNEASPVNIGG
jgi:preprotein translocase subunit SecY